MRSQDGDSPMHACSMKASSCTFAVRLERGAKVGLLNWPNPFVRILVLLAAKELEDAVPHGAVSVPLNEAHGWGHGVACKGR